MFIESKSILEVPSNTGPLSKGPNLEEMIKKQFGDVGLTKFKEHQVQVDVPSPQYEGFSLKIEDAGELLGVDGGFSHIGKVYSIYPEGINMHIERVFAKGVDVQLFRESRADDPRQKSVQFFLTLDLNPSDKKCQYLRLLFQY